MIKKLMLLLKTIAKGKKRWYVIVITILFVIDKLLNDGALSEYFMNILKNL